jgi:hypothetical protein
VIRTIKAAPINSILFVSDPDGGSPPDPVWGAEILATDSCISIGCYPSMDRETTITLGRAADVDPGGAPIFDGMLETPNRALAVTTVDDETLLKEDVSGTRTRVRAWTNRPTMPDRVIIGFD